MVSTSTVTAVEPSWLIMLPFGILLLTIAVAPLIAQHHWERHYHKLCIVLAGVVCLYHLFVGSSYFPIYLASSSSGFGRSGSLISPLYGSA